MKNSEIEKKIAKLATKLSFKINASKNRILLVEGITDVQFAKRIVNSDIVIVNINSIGFDGFSNKKDIKEIIVGTEKFFAVISFPTNFQGVNINGLVDLDYDNEKNYLSYNNLYVTDTHDIETLLISSDERLLVEKFGISIDEYNKACFIAYLFGIIIEYFVNRNEWIDFSSIDCSRNKIDIREYVDENNIDIEKTLESIFTNNKELINNKLKEDIKKDLIKKIKRITYDNFNQEKITDFWKVVNGHFLLYILKYFNKQLIEKYNSNSFLDRAFELEIIKEYDISNFYKTKLGIKMNKNNLIIKMSE